MRTYNLEFHCLAFELNSSDLEVNANCRNVAFCVGIVCKTEEEARLEARDGELVMSCRKESERDTFPTPESPMRRSLKR